MASPERSRIETLIHYSNYLDAGVFALGVITGNLKLVLLGAAGLLGGKVVSDKLKLRREAGKFVI